MRRKNTIDNTIQLQSIEICFNGFFQTDVLINFFIPLTKFRPGKADPGSTKDTIYEEFITLPGYWQSETEFHPSQPGSCNHHLRRLSVKPIMLNITFDLCTRLQVSMFFKNIMRLIELVDMISLLI